VAAGACTARPPLLAEKDELVVAGGIVGTAAATATVATTAVIAGIVIGRIIGTMLREGRLDHQATLADVGR